MTAASRRPVARSVLWLSSLGLALTLSACAGTARPRSLADADATRRSPATRAARDVSPQAVLEADGFLAEAEREQRAGKIAAANALAERASAAYERAFVQARIVQATAALESAKKAQKAAEEENAVVAEEHTRHAAELVDLEGRLKVLKDAPPLYASSKADPMREPARREAALSLVTEARLLCVSARLVAPAAAGLKEAEAQVSDVAKILDDKTKAAPIDEASRARATCLSTLTKARRLAAGPSTDPADVLVAELSREGSFAVVRDDRGVVVTLPAAFTGAALAKGVDVKLEKLGKISAAHPAMPLLIVVHDADPRGADEARGKSRVEAATQALKVPKLEATWVGAARPLIDPKAKDHARNERLEIVFVDGGKS